MTEVMTNKLFEIIASKVTDLQTDIEVLANILDWVLSEMITEIDTSEGSNRYLAHDMKIRKIKLLQNLRERTRVMSGTIKLEQRN